MLVDERTRAYIASMTKKPTEPFITDLGPLVRGDPPIVQRDDGQYQLVIHDDAPGPIRDPRIRASGRNITTSREMRKGRAAISCATLRATFSVTEQDTKLRHYRYENFYPCASDPADHQGQRTTA